jgi:uncharacterized Rmd1/YagE family protein
MPPAAIEPGTSLNVRAIFLGQRLDLRSLSAGERLGARPLVIPWDGEALAIAFRYGVVVLVHCAKASEQEFLGRITPLVSNPFTVPETESLTVSIDPDRDDEIHGDILSLRECTREHLHVIAAILAQSVVLAEYEARVAENFDRIEPFAMELQARGRGGQDMRRLVKQIGNVLLTEHQMVARAEIGEKPEVLWDHPELELLYARLADEFDIRERSNVLDRKLALTAQTVETVQNLLQYQRTLRVEWYIVILILLEIVLTLYELFWR